VKAIFYQSLSDTKAMHKKRTLPNLSLFLFYTIVQEGDISLKTDI